MTRSLKSFLAAALLMLPAAYQPLYAAPIATEDALGTEEDDPTKKEYKEIQDAVAKFQARDFEGCLGLLEQAHVKYPELPPGQILMAQFFFKAMTGAPAQQQAQLMALGRNSLERAIEKDATDPDAYLFLGDLAYAQQRIAEAELLFQKAKQLTDALPDTNVRKADLYKRCLAGNASISEARNKLPEAVAMLTEFSQLASDNPLAFYRLGQAQFKNKEAKSAFESFKKAAALRAEVGPASVIMARLFEQQAVQKSDAAAKKSADQWIDYALKQGAKDPAAQLGVARIYWDRDDVVNAKKSALESLKLKADSRDAKLLLGLIARYEKDLATAEKYFDEIYKSEPTNFASSNQLAIVLADQTDQAKRGHALAIAEANWKDNQTNNNAATAAATLGWVYYRLGNRTEESQKMLQVAMQAGRGNISGDTAYYVSKILVDLGRVDDAKKLLDETLKGKGPFPYRDECQALLTQISSAAPTDSVVPADTSSSPPQ